MAQETNPYDTGQEEYELSLLKQELAQNEASIEADFAKYVAENLNENQEMLMLDNKEAFIREVVLPMQNKFYNERISSKKAREKELEASINQKRSKKSFDDSVNAFMGESKLDNNSFNAMMDFYQNDLPPRTQKELEQLPPNEFFKKVYELYGSTQSQEPQEPLPQQLEGVANKATDETTGFDENPMERY
ncbi:hypothetical protein [Helicobacter sp.]|uniref:hypothetical protein n=1 Tax=Helicobacter sp. TaxID=218 RepID=UPI0019834A12|nr:hypothetical protein [Helicobacter sp.]MBD5165223.1 hypothetical protein [Helicobacter sp.]